MQSLRTLADIGNNVAQKVGDECEGSIGQYQDFLTNRISKCTTSPISAWSLDYRILNLFWDSGSAGTIFALLET